MKKSLVIVELSSNFKFMNINVMRIIFHVINYMKSVYSGTGLSVGLILVGNSEHVAQA